MMIIPFLLRGALSIARSRPADVVIGSTKTPYMLRWLVLPRNRIFNVYIHHFLRSDDDRALHDHPWWNLSLLLDGAYTEHSIQAGGIHRRVIRRAGALRLRRAKAAHRIELHAGPCWTLFIIGPNIRTWGFHCPSGWIDWRDFTTDDENGSSVYVGGCGEV
jgi:hypothetical protein